MMGNKLMTSTSKRAPFVAALLSLILSAFVALPALSQDAAEISPEALALARKYVDLTDTGGLYEATIVQAGIRTNKQLQQIVDFYSSPTGQKLAKSNATTSGTINRIMDVFTSNLNTEFFAAVRAELKSKGIDT